MTYKITIELSDIEKKSLEYDVNDIHEWANHVIKNRARISKTEIIPLVLNYCNENEIAIPVGELNQIEYAYKSGLIKTAHQRELDHQEELKEWRKELSSKKKKNN